MEYGRIVGESTGVGGRGGGSGDVTGQIMDAFSDAADQVAALPPEMLAVFAVVAIIGLMIFRR